ncbi:hypothetical protein DSM104443_03044 [Usitatibacter rugosus]|uniref:Activator of Hsp90 ATPase homologue 1/2-like C-terminal domain-containing protein n=1 Tax=Usitatibacter rugosus TaxID=2732067 RepID=A0A6M4GXG3_9PROT|nr:SRPBCC domain-containing protein [Usitatibacter rugosus]QJR11961.1 hypothetical protein DSM104443_03044 [Usitatibacter rugosus]
MAEPPKAVFKIVINGTMEAVFRELTKTDSPQGAVFNSMLTLDEPGLIPGRKMQMRTVSGRHAVVIGEVMEVEAPRRFAHTHRFTQFTDPSCKVVYDLKQVPGGVEVTLTVENMPAGTKTEVEMNKGGMFILNNLKAIVETGKPSFGCRLMYVMFHWLEFVLPASTKSENWPIGGKK